VSSSQHDGTPQSRAKPLHTRAPTLSSRLSAPPSRVPISESSHARITGRALQTIRRRHFQQQPLCVHCLERGLTTAATQIDHRRPLWDGGQDVESNRQGLCDDCHAEKTADESRRRARLG